MGHLLGQRVLPLARRCIQNQQTAVNSSVTDGQWIRENGFMMPLTFPIPVGQLRMQAEQKAAASKAQLLEDVAALDRYNSDVNGVNDSGDTRRLRPRCSKRTGPSETTGSSGWPGSVRLAPVPRRGHADPDRKPENSISSDRKRALLPGFCCRHAGLDALRTEADRVAAHR